MSGKREALESFKSREAVVWVGTFAILFAASVTALDLAGAPTWVVFVGGLVFGEFADRAVETFTDAYLERRELEGGGRAEA